MPWRPRRRRSWSPAPAKERPPQVDWSHRPVHLHHPAVEFHYKSRKREGRIAEEKAHCRLLQRIAFGRDFNDVSYNACVFPSGRVYILRGEQVLGAHTLGHNEDPGVTLIGNHETQRVTLRAVRGTRKLLTYWHEKYGVKRQLIPHCATYPTSCPGRFARLALRDLIPSRYE